MSQNTLKGSLMTFCICHTSKSVNILVFLKKNVCKVSTWPNYTVANKKGLTCHFEINRLSVKIIGNNTTVKPVYNDRLM